MFFGLEKKKCDDKLRERYQSARLCCLTESLNQPHHIKQKKKINTIKVGVKGINGEKIGNYHKWE